MAVRKAHVVTPRTLPPGLSTSSTLRQRLKSDAKARKHLPERSTKTKSREKALDLHHQLRAGFQTAIGVKPLSQRPIVPTSKRTPDSPCQLAESLASRGAELHATAAAHIGDAFEGIEQKIGQLSEVSIECLTVAESLYDNISYPLSATLCHSENKTRATIADHLSTLHEELASASDKLRSLHSEWQNCVMSQHEAWQELRLLVSDVRNREIGFGEYEKEAKAVARAADQDLDALDTEYKELFQAETMKIMQRIMAD